MPLYNLGGSQVEFGFVYPKELIFFLKSDSREKIFIHNFWHFLCLAIIVCIFLIKYGSDIYNIIMKIFQANILVDPCFLRPSFRYEELCRTDDDEDPSSLDSGEVRVTPSRPRLRIREDVREQHCRTLRQALHVWLDQFPDDFDDPPNYPCLTQLEAFCRRVLPNSELDIKVRSIFEVLLYMSVRNEIILCIKWS